MPHALTRVPGRGPRRLRLDARCPNCGAAAPQEIFPAPTHGTMQLTEYTCRGCATRFQVSAELAPGVREPMAQAQDFQTLESLLVEDLPTRDRRTPYPMVRHQDEVALSVAVVAEDEVGQAPQDAQEAAPARPVLDWVVRCPCGALSLSQAPQGVLSCGTCGQDTPMSTLEAFRRGREVTPGTVAQGVAEMLVGGAAEFALWLRRHPDAARHFLDDEMNPGEMVHAWAAERRFTFERDLIPRVTGARSAVLEAGSVAAQAEAIMHALRRLRDECEGGDPDGSLSVAVARLLFVFKLLETRRHQERVHGRDQRPDQNKVWWVDFIALHADKALDSGNRNGHWLDRMVDVAALALAASEWELWDGVRRAEEEAPAEAARPFLDAAHPLACARCGGLGNDPEPSGVTEVCPRCNGARVDPHIPRAMFDPPDPCDECGGAGHVDIYGPCRDCQGTGQLGTEAMQRAWSETLRDLVDGGLERRLEADAFNRWANGEIGVGGPARGEQGRFRSMTFDPPLTLRDGDRMVVYFDPARPLGDGPSVVGVRRADGTFEVLGETAGPVEFTPVAGGFGLADDELERLESQIQQLASTQGVSLGTATAAVRSAMEGISTTGHVHVTLDGSRCPDCNNLLASPMPGVRHCGRCGYSECG